MAHQGGLHEVGALKPRASYSLTPVGIDLLSVMEKLTGWIARQLPNIRQADRRHLSDR